MSKILLVQPNNEGKKLYKYDCAMPIGLIYIGTVLKHNNHEVKILDRNLYPSDDYLKELLKRGYDFIGIGAYTGRMLYDAVEVSKIVKENSSSIVVWGSFHPTIVPEETLKNPYIDHIIRGEGEEIFLEMVNLHEKGRDFTKIKGLDLNPLATPPDINSFPPIDYGLVEIEKYPNFFVSTSRGCPYKCTFCYNSYGCDSIKPYRNLSFEKSVELIENVVNKYKIKTFTIVDDNFPSDKEKLKKITPIMNKLGIRFDTFCRANYADIETLKLLKSAGCWQIQIGVESGSQRILNFLKKGTTVKMNSEAIQNCKKVGIFSHTSFMIGIPTETIEDIKETIEFIKKNKPDLGGAGIFHPFPKTILWDYCVEKGLIKEPKTIEEWAESYPTGFSGVKMNVSGIPDEVLLKYHKYINELINKGRYFRKTLLYLRNGRIPNYKRIMSILKSKRI
jgi:anaerobic magnesium-protoporphyrin IX monomethyl ester cyclase